MKPLLFMLCMFLSNSVLANTINISLRLNSSGGLEESVNGNKYDYPMMKSKKHLQKQNKSDNIIINVNHDIHYYWLLDYVYYLSSLGFENILVKTNAEVPSRAQTRTLKEFTFRLER